MGNTSSKITSWRPIGTIPTHRDEDGHYIDILAFDAISQSCVVVTVTGDGLRDGWSEYPAEQWDFTHWMPLPSRPVSEH